MGFLPVVPVLSGSLVRLEPLSPDHAADLAVAAEEDREAYGFTVVPRAWEVEQYLAAHSERAKSGMLAPFAQIRQDDGCAIGVTAYWDPRFWPGRAGSHPGLCAIDIGWTWLAASAQRTGINVEAKLLLAGYAFETLKVARVGFSTDARNERSRRALEGLGARFEGVLRHWSPSRAPGEDGLLRDSAVFSVVASEWPAAKAALCRRLARASHRGDGGPMIGQLFSVVLDCPDPRALAQFYSQLLGLPITRAEEGWAQVGDTHSSRLSFQRVRRYQPPGWPDPAFPPQVHLDLQVSDITEAEARVLALGATRLPGTEPGFRVYADPAGHPFCLGWETPRG